MTDEPVATKYGFHLEETRSLSTGGKGARRVTDAPRPEGGDLMRYCYGCDKWTWLIAYWCAECGTRNA